MLKLEKGDQNQISFNKSMCLLGAYISNSFEEERIKISDINDSTNKKINSKIKDQVN